MLSALVAGVVAEPATTDLAADAVVAVVAEAIQPSFLLLRLARHTPMLLEQLALATHLRAQEALEGLAEAQLLQSAVQRLPQLGAAEEPAELTAQQDSPGELEGLALTATLMLQAAADALLRFHILAELVGLARLAEAERGDTTAPQELQVVLEGVAAGDAEQHRAMAAMAAQA